MTLTRSLKTPSEIFFGRRPVEEDARRVGERHEITAREGSNVRKNEFDNPPEIPRDGSLKTYEPPRVECYGKLHQVTQMGGSIPTDSGGNFGHPP